jgi:hypothetical protein
MNSKIYIDGYGYLDMYENINVPLNFSIADVSNIANSNSSFSKTIILPGSKNNNRILGNIFEIALNYLDCDFNINRKVKAIIYQNDVPVLTGFFKLLKVNKLSPSDISFEQNLEYECVVFGEKASLFDIIKDNDIADIDLSQYNHILSFSAITGTSNNTYLQGYKYINHYTSDNKYKVGDFRPSIYVKTIFDKIFEDAGFTYTSTFLNSEPFTKLLIPTNVKDLLISDDEVDKRSIRVSFSSGYSVNNINSFTKTPTLGQYGNANPSLSGIVPFGSRQTNIACNLVSTSPILNINTTTQLKFNDETTGINFDGSYDNYSLTNFIYTAPKTGQYEIDLNLAGSLNVTVPALTYILTNYDSDNRWFTEQGLPKFAIVAYFYKRNPNLPVLQQLTLLNTAVYNYLIPTQNQTFGGVTYPTIPSGTTNYNYTFKPENFIVDLNKNEQVGVYFKVITYATYAYKLSPTAPVQIQYNFNINGYNTSNSYLKVNAVKNALTTGDEIVLNDMVPKNIRQADFIKSIVNMFNLYLIPDSNNEKNIIIKTRDEFYSDYENQYVDWTSKMDYSQEYSITLLSELQNKKLNFKYKDGNDEVNKRYREQTGFEYGQYILNFDNDFLTGERKIEVIFEPTPLVKTLLPLGDEGGTFIVPFLQYGKETAPKILYDGGSISVSDYNLVDVDDSGNTVNYTLNYYNYAGHFDNPVTPTFDLNWNINSIYFYNEVLDNVTVNNLYNLYWYNYVNLIAQSKLLTAYFNLDEYDIANLNFAKLIWIRDSYYILNKIVDYNATSNGLTKVELIKAINSPKFNRGYQSVSPIFTDTQTTNPIRFVGSDVLTNNVTFGISGNQNWGTMSYLYGRDNNILTYVKNSNINGDRNIIGISSENIDIKGNDNFVGGNSEKVFIKGNNNKLDGGNINISLINCNNVRILSGIKNVSISNLSNTIIDKSNFTLLSTYFKQEQGFNINNSEVIDSGLDIVYPVKYDKVFEEDIIDSGIDETYKQGNNKADVINSNVDGNQVDYDFYLNNI